MEKKVLKGKIVADKIKNDIKTRVDNAFKKYGEVPTLVTIMVGDDEGSKTYVRMKSNACKKLGIENKKIILEKSTTEELLKIIDELNMDDSVNGILIQHPLPRNIDESACFNAIDVVKDVDGVNTESFGHMTMKQDAFVSATPKAIMEILHHYDIDVSGKHAVVVGRSPILGKPVAMLLLNEDATVTICHTKTKNIDQILKTADIVVAACGQPKFIKEEWLKEGVTIIDAGYNKGNIGDVDPACYEKASAYTPVPGGVGPVTIAELLEQTVTSFEKTKKRQIKKANQKIK